MSFEVAQHDEVIEVDGVTVLAKKLEQRAIPLRQLFLSASNVRTVRDPASIPPLADMIATQGLLLPLCVVLEKRKGVRGVTFGVVAGGRRLAALLLLVEQGRLSLDAPIQCVIVAIDRAVEVSLTENVSQEGMHPADEVMAFKKLVDQGKSAGQIAAAFGVSTTTVEKRLKLANLAPVFMELFRENKIDLDQLQALALANNHQERIEAWESLPS